MKITDKTLQDMADFYCRTVFDHIPEINVYFGDVELMEAENAAGLFMLEKADDYDTYEDELIHAYEYRPETISFEGGQEYILTANGMDVSFQDPLNHPTATIMIHPKYRYSIRKLTAILMHELLHYYLWYIGWDYHDDSRQFLDECKKRGFVDNYSYFVWNKRKREMVDTYDYSKMDRYIEMYNNSISIKAKESIAA